MSDKKEVIKNHNKIQLEIKNRNDIHNFKSNLPTNMTSDAFTALCVSILQEFFMSTDAKTMIFEGMLYNLKTMGYTEIEMDKFRERVNQAIITFHKPNSFMG